MADAAGDRKARPGSWPPLDLPTSAIEHGRVGAGLRPRTAPALVAPASATSGELLLSHDAGAPGADERWKQYAGQRPAPTRPCSMRWWRSSVARIRASPFVTPAASACADRAAWSVNGRERWACRTLLSTLGPGRITVRPLYHFPVLRDLGGRHGAVHGPDARRGGGFTPGDGERRDARISGDSAERQEIDGAIECIGCGLCVSASHDRRPQRSLPRTCRVEPGRSPLQRDSRDAARSRAGASCSQTTRSRAVTARPIARMCARWSWRRRGRSFACARWRPPGY